MRRRTLALVILLAAGPAGAQQYWLPNGPGGTTYNNPNGSLPGTMNEHLLQRHMMQRQYGSGAQGNGGARGAAGAPAAAVGRDPSFRLNNQGSRTIREIYVSSAQDSAWGVDRLGAQVLQPGQALVIRLPAGQCLNDIRVVFADGQASERRQVDTCAIADLPMR